MGKLTKEEAEKRGILTTRKWYDIREHEVYMDIERARDSKEDIPLLKKDGTEKKGMGVNEEELEKIDRKVSRGTTKTILGKPMTFEYLIADRRLRGNYRNRAYSYDEIMAAYYTKPSPAGSGYRWQLYHYQVKEILEAEGPMTAKEILGKTGIPKRSLYRTLDTMENMREVEFRLRPSEGGKPAKEYFVPNDSVQI